MLVLLLLLDCLCPVQHERLVGYCLSCLYHSTYSTQVSLPDIALGANATYKCHDHSNVTIIHSQIHVFTSRSDKNKTCLITWHLPVHHNHLPRYFVSLNLKKSGPCYTQRSTHCFLGLNLGLEIKYDSSNVY